MNRGEIVISKRGSDKGKLYVVLKCDESGRLLIADGKRHTLSEPKVKNPKHVSSTGQLIDVPNTDALLVTAIRRIKPLID